MESNGLFGHQLACQGRTSIIPRDMIWLDDLRQLLPAERILTNPSAMFVYEYDAFTIARSRPAAVVFPTSTLELSAVLNILDEHNVPIIPRGSGTGLAGGCIALQYGVIISTSKMTRICKIDVNNRVAQVEAGVRNTALSDAVATTKGGEKLHFAPDPSSGRASTIGGNAATNAGGVHTLKDFVTSNHILGVTMVLPDGEILTVGGQDGCYEDSPFDLPGLICGSEGTLGIITELWVRLVPKPTYFSTLVATFSSSNDACETVSEIISSGMLPAAMEMMDGQMIRVVEDAFHFGFSTDAKALLLIELDGVSNLVEAQIKRVAEICRMHHAVTTEQSNDPARRAALWKARKSAFGAIGRISHSYCTQDACVPRSMLADVLAKIEAIGREHGLLIPSAFHAGDGNIHPIFLYDETNEAQVQDTLKAAEKVLKYCIDIGGTLTGEHGVGVEKIHLMPYLFDAPTMEQFNRIRAVFDPKERINAGKLLPSEKVSFNLINPGRNVPQ